MNRRILTPLVLAGAVALAALTGCSAPAPTPDTEDAATPETPTTETVVTDCPAGLIDTLSANAAQNDLGVDLNVAEISLAEFTEVAGLPAGSFAGGCSFTAELAGLTTASAYLPGATGVADVFLAAGATDQGEQAANGVNARSLLLDGRIIGVVEDGIAAIEASGEPEALKFTDSFPDGVVIVTVIYDGAS